MPHSQAEVVEQLRGQGRLPLAAEPVGAAAARPRASLPVAAPAAVRPRPRAPREVALMTRELATLLDAGLTLDHSLRLMVDLVEGEALRRLLADLLQRVQGGSTLADALAQHEAVFSRAYVSMVRAGEAGGSLDDVLGRLAQYPRSGRGAGRAGPVGAGLPARAAGDRRAVDRGAAHRGGAAVHAPVRERRRRAAAADPGRDRDRRLRPALLVGAGCSRSSRWSGWCAASCARPQSRARIDRWLLRLPLLGRLLAKIDTARLARTLGTLLANGVPMLNALAIAHETLGNAVLREALSETATAVKEGRGLAEPLARAGPFPPLAIHLLSVGERSGRLEPMLLKIAEIFDRETRSTIER